MEEGGLHLDHTLSMEQIGQVRADVAAETGRGALPARAGQRTVGLTVAEFRLGKATRGKLLGDGKAVKCMQVTHIDLRIGYTDQTVYVPSTYDVDSCEYHAILAHEGSHVDDNLAVLEDFAPYFKNAAETFGDSIGLVPVGSRDEARARTLDLLDAALAPVAEAFHVAQAERAARRDSREEYAAVARRCSNW